MNAYERASENRVELLMRYEAGELNDSEIIGLFQVLIDDGTAWKLQGAYGRMADRLINAGFCSKPIGA